MIEIDLHSLKKIDRGLRREKVPVHRKTGTTYEYRRVGRKENKHVEDVPVVSKPDPKILDLLKNKDTQAMDVEDDGSFLIGTNDFGDLKMKLEGNKIVNLSTGLRITVPDNFEEQMEKDWRFSIWHVCKFLIDGEMGMSYENKYKQDMEGREMYNEVVEVIDNEPVYEDATESGAGKYQKAMKLHINTQRPIKYSSTVPKTWYDGTPNDFSCGVKAIQEILNNEFDEDNILHPGLKPIIDASKAMSDNHGSDNIYRGETNIERAKMIINTIVDDGEFELPNHIMSWTENEKLGKWYGGTHNQNAPSSGTQTKTNVMLKIGKDQYLPNVALDYRVCGDDMHPEEEITITGNGIKLTGDNVMVYTMPPGKKRRKWMSYNDFIIAGGDYGSIISSMSIGSEK